MADLAVLIPTRGRPANIRQVIGAWDFTNAWDVADMWLLTDADDAEAEYYERIVEETRNPDTGEPIIAVMEHKTWMPMVHKVDIAARMVADLYFAVGFAGDDHLPQTINWAQTYLANLRQLGTGMVYGDDGYQGRKLSTEWAVTADAVHALGRMVPAPVEHLYCDNSMMDVFGGAGAMLHLPGVRIEHMHPIAGKASNDAQYKRVNSSEQFRRDRPAYEGWKLTTLPGQIAKIKALRPGKPMIHPKEEKRPMITRTPFPKSFKQIRGVTPADIEITLADLAVLVPADQEIVELGTFHGKTALVLAWGASQGKGAHVTAIDPWEMPGNVYGDEMGDLAGARKWARYWVQSLGYANRIQLVQGFSHEVAERYADPEITTSPIGLLFIDGDHTEEGARRDIESWAPHLAPGAKIAIDDYGNPNYPGVRIAVDSLVAEGVLAPVEVFHDRLAVTRLTERVEDGPAKYGAITSEGVSPSPELTPDVQFPVPEASISRAADLEEEWRQVDPEGVAALEASAAELDETMSKRETVQMGESENDSQVGQSIENLNLTQLKALAKTRGIRLGARKDLRAQILQALRDGE